MCASYNQTLWSHQNRCGRGHKPQFEPGGSSSISRGHRAEWTRIPTFPACCGQAFLPGGASRTVHSSLLLSGECWWVSICERQPGGAEPPDTPFLRSALQPGGDSLLPSSCASRLIHSGKEQLTIPGSSQGHVFCPGSQGAGLSVRDDPACSLLSH